MQFRSLVHVRKISRLNLFFGNDVFSDKILSTVLVAFVYADVMLLILFRTRSLIKT